MQAEFQKAVPIGTYAFYVMKAAVPKDINDLSLRELFVVCSKGMNPYVGIDIAASSIDVIGMPMFKSVRIFMVSQTLRTPVVDKPGMKENGTTILKCKNSSKQFTFVHEVLGYGQGTKENTLFNQCIEEIKKDPQTSVLMCKQGVSFPGRKDMVELRFQ